MSLVKPIVLFGSGRSGSTVMCRSFARHPGVAWPSGISERYPTRPALGRRLMEWLDVPVAGALLQQRFEPAEAYTFWEYYCKGFRRPNRDLLASDLTNKQRKSLAGALEQITTGTRPRLLMKITGWPRVGFLHGIFPDAKFIHIIRDGRAVANSLLNVDFWQGWNGPQNWRFGLLSPTLAAEWDRHDRSFVALAAIQWKILMAAAEAARALVPAAQYLEVKYEELCSDAVGTFRRVTTFCELPWSDRLEAHIRARTWLSENDKWRKDLTADQQRILQDVTHDCLLQYGYSPD